MRFLRSSLLYILDCCFTWFTPAWRRQGNEAASALTRYLNYYRPEIATERMEELSTLRAGLRRALFEWNREEVQKLTGLVNSRAESLRGFKRSPIAEMVESFFVIMVVFMGLRTYYAQPFRIPTGSMQPSLNGIIVHPVEELPSLPVRCWHALTLGSSYVDKTAPQDMELIGIRDETYWLLFSQTRLTFRGKEDGRAIEITIPAASGTVMEYLKKQGKMGMRPASTGGYRMSLGSFRRGETIMRGRADAGDMVIVNRMAYHFRKPRRGETFVFDTRGIRTKASGGLMQEQSGGTHYIKRLCGLPGDCLEVQTPRLLVNGGPAQETAIARVAACKPPFNAEGYQALPAGSLHLGRPAFLTAGTERRLRDDSSEPNLREYVALGDNTTNSLDSRYWGAVHQFNIIGPASFTLWPVSSHWGGIE